MSLQPIPGRPHSSEGSQFEAARDVSPSASNEERPVEAQSNKRTSYRKLSPEDKCVRDNAITALCKALESPDPNGALQKWKLESTNSTNCEICKISPITQTRPVKVDGIERIRVAYCQSCSDITRKRISGTLQNKTKRAASLEGGQLITPSLSFDPSNKEAPPSSKRRKKDFTPEKQLIRDAAILKLVQAGLMDPVENEKIVQEWKGTVTNLKSGNCMICRESPSEKKRSFADIPTEICMPCDRRFRHEQKKAKASLAGRVEQL